MDVKQILGIYIMKEPKGNGLSEAELWVEKESGLETDNRYSWVPTFDPRTQSGCPSLHSDKSCWEEGIVCREPKTNKAYQMILPVAEVAD